MKIEKVGRFPVNSSCKINFETDPPTIEFGYPDPDTSIVRRSDVTYLISMVFAGIIFLILLSSYTILIQPKFYPHISNTDITIDNVEISRYEYFNGFNKLLINYTWNDKPHFTKLSLSQEGPIFPMPYFYDSVRSSSFQLFRILGQEILLIILFFVLTVINSFWVAKVFKDTKWGNKKYPEFNKRLHNAHYSAEFSPENFPVNNIIEIPLFKNMYMDYDAIGDFAEQLKKISIIEHPFNKLVKKGFFKKQIIKKPQVNLWKCIFEFKEKPKDGRIEIRFT